MDNNSNNWEYDGDPAFFDDETEETPTSDRAAPGNALIYSPAPHIEINDEMIAQVRANSALLDQSLAEQYNIIILDQPFGRYRYRIGMLKPLSVEDRRSISRDLKIFNVSAFKFQLLEGSLFSDLFLKAYDTGSQLVRQKRETEESTRETRTWGENAQTSAADSALEDSFDELGGSRYDISNLDEYFRIDKSLASGELDESQIKTSKFIVYLLQDFILSGASDLHIHAHRGGGRIRYRFQGLLYVRFDEIPRSRYRKLVNALCNMAAKEPSRMNQEVVESVIKLKITYKGKVRPVEFRFESLPSNHNPSVNLRGQTDPITDITKIGFTEEQLPLVRHVIDMENGVVVTTGATGSGKTNTLNAIFAILEEPDDKCIVELGSPIEIESPKRVQLTIRETPSEKVTDIIYQKFFKACLRFDPDVLGFTEIRSPDEARIAYRAANSGHLVFTTFHAYDLEETLGVLLSMHIDRSVIAKGTLAVIAQTLVRVLCQHCRVVDEDYSSMNDEIIYRADDSGCEKCDKGYHGRTVIAEVCVFDEEIRKRINEGLSPAEISKFAVKSGRMIPMRQIALQKVKAGITSEEEVVNMVELRTEINSDLVDMPNPDDYDISFDDDENIIEGEFVD